MTDKDQTSPEMPEADLGNPDLANPDLEGGFLAPPEKVGLLARFRTWFLTGIVVATPIWITAYVTVAFIDGVDGFVGNFIPGRYNPEAFLPFSIPGLGLLVMVILLTLIGFLTTNFLGKRFLTFAERLVARMPIVRNIYNALKQISETVFTSSSRSFTHAGLIEYPRKGLWAIVFLTADTTGEIAAKSGGDGEDMISVFLPTTPNPTSGFLLFVPKKDLTILDMSVEEAAKMVISAGLVTPEWPKPQAEEVSEDD